MMELLWFQVGVTLRLNNVPALKFQKLLRADSAWLFLKFTLATFRNKPGKKYPPGRPGGHFCEFFLVKRGGGHNGPPYRNAQNEPKIANKGI